MHEMVFFVHEMILIISNCTVSNYRAAAIVSLYIFIVLFRELKILVRVNVLAFCHEIDLFSDQFV